MKIAVASGKGGTGKTTVAASLARVWDAPLTVADLDVEAPNLHLFLQPRLEGSRTAYLEVPVADESACTACGACAEICQFKAITLLGEVLLTFPDMCHGCGGCLAVCPSGALSPGQRELGEVRWGRAGEHVFVDGHLRVGEAMSPPLMRQVFQQVSELQHYHPGDLIIDAPPGASCPAVTAVRDCDLVVLVAEPTPFGLHDLRIAREAFQQLGPRQVAVINRAGSDYQEVHRYCHDTGLEILAQIPFSREAALSYSRGRVLADTTPELEKLFRELAAAVKERGAEAEKGGGHA